MKIEFAGPQDEVAIKELLAECRLPFEDIRPGHLKHFFVLTEEGRLIGVIGIEPYGNAALLRSLAIHKEHRKQGLAGDLVNRAEQYARASGINTLYLLTDTAERFFLDRGYRKTKRQTAPEILQQATEFNTLCPLSSVCMVKYNLKKQELLYFPKSRLCLQNDIPGARQWAVALNQTMLTYFEVERHCRFESHAHESEQITLVLEGVLYFEQDEKIIGVNAGEVIAIPSHAPHAVFT